MLKYCRSYLLVAVWALCYLPLLGCGGGTGDGSDSRDLTVPQVVSTNPAHLATAVEPNRLITATFNKSINASTVNAESFRMTNNVTGMAVSGSIDYDPNSRTAIFQGNFETGTTYTATLTRAVSDIAGNSLADNYVWEFETGSGADVIAPTINLTFPDNGAMNVTPNTSVSATFSEPVNPTKINTQTFFISHDGINKELGNLTINGNTVTFRPDFDLEFNVLYTATITTGVEDLAGNSLGSNYTWNFRTSAEIDLEPPQILSVSPADGAQNVPLNSALTTNFNEPITPFEFGVLDGRPIEVTFNNTFTSATMAPSVSLRPGATYTVSIKVSDAAGNEMPEAFSWQFTTTAQN